MGPGTAKGRGRLGKMNVLVANTVNASLVYGTWKSTNGICYTYVLARRDRFEVDFVLNGGEPHLFSNRENRYGKTLSIVSQIEDQIAAGSFDVLTNVKVSVDADC